MRVDEQRRLYEDTMGTAAMERQVIERERKRGCKCEEKLILANRTRNAGAGHDSSCPLQAENQWDGC